MGSLANTSPRMQVYITHPGAWGKLTPCMTTIHMLLLNNALLGWQQLEEVTPNHCLYSSTCQQCSSSS